MATSTEIKQRANALAGKTDVNSITPKEVGGIMYDLASHGENVLRNGGTLGIRKVYESVASMEADSTNPKDFWGNPIKKGNLVVIYDGTTTGVDNNKIYAFMNPGWQIATHLDAGYATKAETDAKLSELGSKAIKIKAFSNFALDAPDIGDVYYNLSQSSPNYKKLMRRVSFASTGAFEIIPYYDGAIYTYNNELYIWNGTDLKKYDITNYNYAGDWYSSNIIIDGNKVTITNINRHGFNGEINSIYCNDNHEPVTFVFDNLARILVLDKTNKIVTRANNEAFTDGDIVLLAYNTTRNAFYSGKLYGYVRDAKAEQLNQEREDDIKKINEYANSIESKVEYVNGILDVKTASENIDLLSIEDRIGTIQSDGSWVGNSANNIQIEIPSSASAVTITCGSETGTRYAFLKQMLPPDVNLNLATLKAAYFADGVTGHTVIGLNTSKSVTIPYDAKYLYLWSKSTSGDNRRPSMVEMIEVQNSYIRVSATYTSQNATFTSDGIKLTSVTRYGVDGSFKNIYCNDEKTEMSYTFSGLGRFLVLDKDEKFAMRVNNADFRNGDVVLLYYSTVVKKFVGGKLFPLYISSTAATQEQSDMPENIGVYNAIRKAYQMLGIEWTAKDVIPWNNGTFPAGSTNKGAIYSSVKEYSKYLMQDISLETFMTAVNNPRSVLYTENISKENSKSALGRVYNGTNCAAYYGSVCSALISMAYGLPFTLATYDLRVWDEMEVVEDQSAYGVKLADCLYTQGHVALVTDIKRNSRGVISKIQVTENAMKVTSQTEYTVSGFNNLLNDYTILRYKKLYKNQEYKPLTNFVAVEGEELKGYTYNNDICPNYGDKTNYRSDEDIVLNVLSSGWSILEYYKDDILVGSIDVTSQDITLNGLEFGDYKACLKTTDGKSSQFCYWKVVSLSVVKTGANTFSFECNGATPSHYRFVGPSGGTGNVDKMRVQMLTDAEIAEGNTTLELAQPTESCPYLRVWAKNEYGTVINQLLRW